MKNDQVLNDFKNFFDQKFQAFIEESYPEGSGVLNDAINYALRGNGKRVRPLLVFLVNHALGGKKEEALAPAIAVEMVHTYSLVHDDMPILDDDDLRRGRKTTHVVFDEPTALLVGNSILTDAFSLVSGDRFPSTLNSEQKNLMILDLAKSSGSSGMVLGQMLDLYWTQKLGFAKEDLDKIHLNKTGKLLGCSCALGALSFNVDSSTKDIMKNFGEILGLSFQIIDDILDLSTETGKSLGKDQEQGKLTYLSLYNRETAQELASKKVDEALSLIEKSSFLVQKELLLAFVKSLLKRTY